MSHFALVCCLLAAGMWGCGDVGMWDVGVLSTYSTTTHKIVVHVPGSWHNIIIVALR